MTDPSLVLLEEFQDSFAANVAKGFLESNGIESFLFDEDTQRMGALTGRGGVRLMVNHDNLAAAEKFLAQVKDRKP